MNERTTPKPKSVNSAIRTCVDSVAQHLVPPISILSAGTSEEVSEIDLLKTRFTWAEYFDSFDDLLDASKSRPPVLVVLDHLPINFHKLQGVVAPNTQFIFALQESDKGHTKVAIKQLKNMLSITLYDADVEEIHQAMKLMMALGHTKIVHGDVPLYTVDPNQKHVLSQLVAAVKLKKSLVIQAPERDTGMSLYRSLIEPMPKNVKAVIERDQKISKTVNDEFYYVFLLPQKWQIEQFLELSNSKQQRPRLIVITDNKTITKHTDESITKYTDEKTWKTIELFEFLPLAERPEDILLHQLLAYTQATHQGPNARRCDLSKKEILLLAKNSPLIAFQKKLENSCIDSSKRGRIDSDIADFLEKYGHWDLKAILEEIERQIVMEIRERARTFEGSAQATGIPVSTLKRKSPEFKTHTSLLREDPIKG